MIVSLLSRFRGWRSYPHLLASTVLGSSGDSRPEPDRTWDIQGIYPAPPNYRLRDPIYQLIETIRPLMGLGPGGSFKDHLISTSGMAAHPAVTQTLLETGHICSLPFSARYGPLVYAIPRCSKSPFIKESYLRHVIGLMAVIEGKPLHSGLLEDLRFLRLFSTVAYTQSKVLGNESVRQPWQQSSANQTSTSPPHHRGATHEQPLT